MRRVVITGMGVITSCGNTVDEFWGNMTAGKHGFSPLDIFTTGEYKTKFAAVVRNFNPEEYIDKKDARRMDRYCQLAVAAAKLAVEDAQNPFEGLDPFRVGTIVGTGIGGMHTFECEHEKLLNKGPGRVSPLFIPMMIANMAAGAISMAYGIKGDCYATVTACSSSTHAIGEAFRAIRHGYLDAAVTGGSEATITPISVAGFGNMMALSGADDIDRASIPFDVERDGFVIGEGAAILVIEELEHAKARGAKIYAEIAGFGSTGDAYHITSPDPEGEGAARAMKNAIADAGLKPEDVDYINAHGTGTPLNDKYETVAIKKALGDYAAKVAISSTKSMTGHLLGAAGALETIVITKAITDGIIPPTINLKQPDPECDLDYVPNTARKIEVNVALSNSLGFGGHNGSILVKKFS